MKFLGAVGVVVLASAGPAYAQAGFDCGKASSATEIAICADPEISAADRAMSVAYSALIGRADDGRLKQSLVQDQRDFVALREEAYATGRQDDGARLRLLEDTEMRAEFLNWVSLDPAPGLSGTWRNAWGGIAIEISDDAGITVTADVADQANGSWLCGYAGEMVAKGEGKAQGMTLAGPLIVQRQGAMLEVPVPFCDETGPAVYGSLEGRYFRIGADD